MIFDGYNGGTVEVLDKVLIIRRKGVTSLLTQGLKGEKRIPFSSITSVQFKEPGLATGYIQFGVMGGVEGRGGVLNATTDENTVLFVKKALNEFRQLRDLVESRIGGSAETASFGSVPQRSFVEELGRLADLRDRGVLTDEEFVQEKARLQRERETSGRPTPDAPGSTPKDSAAVQSEALSDEDTAPKKSTGRKVGMGCLVIIAVMFALAILGAIVGPEKTGNGSPQADSGSTSGAYSADRPVSAASDESDSTDTRLTGPQKNAVRSAEQYLSISGFSRAGLIDQLSSSAGNGYSVSDATVAVDSLSVDWNENAARSAKQYLDISGFSCAGMIEQLSSRAGNKYTKSQATYGAHQAGAC
jgi:hypothetical protein